MTDDQVVAIERGLAALEAQIASLRAIVAGLLPPAQEADPLDCAHPADAREAAAAMGKPRQFKCRLCLAVVDPDAGGSQS